MCSFLLCVAAGIFLWILTVLWEDFSPSSSPLPLHCQCWGWQRSHLHQLRCSGSLHFSGRRGWSCMCHELPSAQSSTLRVFSFTSFMSYLYCSKFWKVKHDVRSALDFTGLPRTWVLWEVGFLNTCHQIILTTRQYDHVHDIHPGVFISSVVDLLSYRCKCSHPPCSPLMWIAALTKMDSRSSSCFTVHSGFSCPTVSVVSYPAWVALGRRCLWHLIVPHIPLCTWALCILGIQGSSFCTPTCFFAYSIGRSLH